MKGKNRDWGEFLSRNRSKVDIMRVMMKED